MSTTHTPAGLPFSMIREATESPCERIIGAYGLDLTEHQRLALVLYLDHVAQLRSDLKDYFDRFEDDEDGHYCGPEPAVLLGQWQRELDSLARFGAGPEDGPPNTFLPFLASEIGMARRLWLWLAIDVIDAISGHDGNATGLWRGASPDYWHYSGGCLDLSDWGGWDI